VAGDGLAIRLDGLTRNFGTVRAVDGLTLEVPRGIIFGFLGPNGAGKTTTINLLLGLLEPTSGEVEVLGLDPRLDGDAVRSRTGAVLDQAGIYDQLTAEENLEFYGRASRLGAHARRERIRELLTAAGLWERRGDRAGSWSRGMRQQLALARALLHGPELVLLDEPTAGLDVMAATSVRAGLADITARSGATIFLTTHNMAEAELLCAMVAVVRAGRLIALGSPHELRARSGAPRVEIFGRGFDGPILAELRGQPGVTAVQRTNGHLVLELAAPVEAGPFVSLLVRRGAEVDEVRRGQASLEDVFVTLMEEER
jgi:ABC-2 type transport system ATP-binding protein